MNLSVIERLVREGDMSADALRYLLNCGGECEWLDYKQQVSLDQDHDLCEFARDVLAMKNVGGGYIVVGVQDKTWAPLGLSTRLPYDSKLLRDKIRKAAAVDLDVDIVHHEVTVGSAVKVFGLVLIRGSKKRRKRRAPTVAGKDFCSNQSFGLRRGDIFFGEATRQSRSPRRRSSRISWTD